MGGSPAPRTGPRLRVIAGGAGRAPEDQPGPFDSWVERIEGYRWVLLLLGLLLVARLVVASRPGLAADEAYYWTWSQQLAWGYFDHPPLVAWLIRASTAVLGGTELAVRGLSVLAGVLAVGLLAVSSRRPWITALACAVMPLFAVGGILATPDVPLALGWALAVFGVLRGGRWWLLVGVGLALAILGKLTGLLLVPLLVLARPGAWRSRWPWLGMALALLLLLPWLAWMASHDWITLLYQADHGLALGGSELATAADAPRPGLAGLGDFLVGQAGLVSPLLLLCFLAFWAVGWLERGAVRMWWWLSFPVFAFFAGASLLAGSEPNWPAPAYLAACMGLAHLSTRWRRVAWVGIGFAGIGSTLVLVHALRPLWPVPRDPTLELVGGEVLGQAVQAWGVEPVYTTRYQEAAWIRFYGGLHAEVLPGPGRSSQFDLWPRHPEPEHALFVRPWRRSPPHRLVELWDEREGPNTVVAPDLLLRRAGRWQVYELRGYRGGIPGVPPAGDEP